MKQLLKGEVPLYARIRALAAHPATLPALMAEVQGYPPQCVSISFRKSTPPQTRERIVDYY